MELLVDAETFYILHSLCFDENDRVRLSKARVRGFGACAKVPLIFLGFRVLGFKSSRKHARQ